MAARSERFETHVTLACIYSFYDICINWSDTLDGRTKLVFRGFAAVFRRFGLVHAFIAVNGFTCSDVSYLIT